MKAVILAGGLGTRISEETQLRPKPMVEVGARPIIWHVMKIYSAYGINDFVICCGYKGYMIKEYFLHYFEHMSDMTIDLTDNSVVVHERFAEPWRITMVNTGEHTMTGGRLRRVRRFVEDEEAFCFTYGDGVADVDILDTIRFHKAAGRKATVTSVHAPGRFGALHIEKDRVAEFREKPKGDGALINGGFFVLSPEVIDYIGGDETTWEREPLERLAREGQLGAYIHHGFWQPLDTLRDRLNLEELWASGKAPWKVWT